MTRTDLERYRNSLEKRLTQLEDDICDLSVKEYRKHEPQMMALLDKIINLDEAIINRVFL